MTEGGGRRSLARKARSALLKGAAKVGWHPFVTVSGGVAEGLRMSMRQASADYSAGTNELPVQEAVARHLHPGGVFYDVGSNVGFFALIAARIVGPHGHAYAFEPVPANAGCIMANARRNRLSNVTVMEMAVGAARGTARLLITRHPGGATLTSGHTPTDVTGEIEVAVCSLDALLDEGRVDPPTLVKIDVEGFEKDVLTGMERILEEHRPAVIFEVDDAEPVGLRRKMDALGEVFHSHRYKVQVLPPSYGHAEWNVAHAVATPDN